MILVFVSIYKVNKNCFKLCKKTPLKSVEKYIKNTNPGHLLSKSWTPEKFRNVDWVVTNHSKIQDMQANLKTTN